MTSLSNHSTKNERLRRIYTTSRKDVYNMTARALHDLYVYEVSIFKCKRNFFTSKKIGGTGVVPPS
jgi:hypothetical protein